jgi:hypothetical protein
LIKIARRSLLFALPLIRAIGLPKLENICNECGLTKIEIQGAMVRAQRFREKTQLLMEQGHVVKPNEWKTSHLVGEFCNPQKFSANRHAAGK